MVAVRYSPGKVWANFVCAVLGGLVAVVVIGSVWETAALIGGIAGMVAVVIMLLPGVVRRSERREPFLTIDAKGVTVDLLGIGTIPWSQLKGARISGIPWVTGQRLVLEYTGAAPKVGFKDKLNWGIQARQRGQATRLTIGFIDMTDQSKSRLEAALSRVAAASAA